MQLDTEAMVVAVGTEVRVQEMVTMVRVVWVSKAEPVVRGKDKLESSSFSLRSSISHSLFLSFSQVVAPLASKPGQRVVVLLRYAASLVETEVEGCLYADTELVAGLPLFRQCWRRPAGITLAAERLGKRQKKLTSS
jgi:hypothetical protein